jgi:single-strand DNA-binding protein
LVKSTQIYIEGRLQTRRWEDSEGTKHVNVEIVATEMMILGDRRENKLTSDLDPSTIEESTEEYPF